MGIEQNAFLAYSDGMTEDSCFTHCRDNKITSMCRLICCKKKYVAFLTGNMDTSARMFDLYHDFAVGPVGELSNEELNQDKIDFQAQQYMAHCFVFIVQAVLSISS